MSIRYGYAVRSVSLKNNQDGLPRKEKALPQNQHEIRPSSPGSLLARQISVPLSPEQAFLRYLIHTVDEPSPGIAPIILGKAFSFRVSPDTPWFNEVSAFLSPDTFV